MTKYSVPSVKKTNHPARAQTLEFGPLDWSRVDVAAMIERHTETRLSSKEHRTQLVGPCPFYYLGMCTGDTDGFVVWPHGSPRSTERSTVHYMCRNCPEDRKSGDLIKLLRLLHPDWTFKRAQIEIGMIDEDGNVPQDLPVSERLMSPEDLAYAAWTKEQLEMLLGYYSDFQRAITRYERPQKYLLSRGISLADAQVYGLGYFPTREESGHKIDDQHIKVINKWMGRIIFPLGSQRRDLTFEGRTLELWQEGMSPSEHKKAIEAHDAGLPKKQQIGRVLKTAGACGHFGYAEAIKSSHLVICEGPFDALSLRLARVENVIAMGTSLSPRDVPLNVSRVTLALDADKSGANAAYNLREGLLDRGVEVRVCLPGIPGADWNDIHSTSGLAAIAKAFATPDIVQPTAAAPPLDLPTEEAHIPTYEEIHSSPEFIAAENAWKDEREKDIAEARAAAAREDLEQPQLEESEEYKRLVRFGEIISKVNDALGGDCVIERVDCSLQDYIRQRSGNAYRPGMRRISSIPFTGEEKAILAHLLQWYDARLTILPCPTCACRIEVNSLGSYDCANCDPAGGWSNPLLERIAETAYAMRIELMREVQE